MGLFGSKEKTELKEKAKKILEQAPVGASDVAFQSRFSCVCVFAIAPKAIEVGVKRSKELKNKLVVSGSVRSGSFSKEETVAILGSDGVVKANAVILDVIPDDGTLDFQTELSANMHKKEVGSGGNAWLILDVEEGIESGDIVAGL
ncbi:MAG: hypothetical protein IKG93_13080 [Clostridiales bacterium]|nr:hypothetical protein [Clostridiales bacterium]